MKDLCKIQDCNRQVSAKALCKMHYERIRRGKEIYIPTSSCSVKDCQGTGKFIKGYCDKHYKQVSKYGRTLTDQEIFINRSNGRKANPARNRGGYKMKDTTNMRGHHPKSQFKKGLTPWNKGLKNWLTPEHKEILRKYALGRRPWNKIGDGITPQDRRERLRFQQQYQRKVFERDNYTCQICEQYSGYLQVDHIKSWKDNVDLRFELSNCRTLCMACHYYITFKRKMPKGTIWGHNLSKRVAS